MCCNLALKYCDILRCNAHILHSTDLRAARGAAHIRPVLFVIHVIHKPATQRRQEQHVNLQPRHAACRDVFSLLCDDFSSLFCVFILTETMPSDTIIVLLSCLYCGSGV